MALGFAPGIANAILDALARNVSFANAAVWVKLHVGDPGAAGASNPAGETDRIQATFGSAAAGAAISNTASLTWVGVSTAEDYTHLSLWSASTLGTFLGSGLMTANAVLVNDDFIIPVGDLDLTLPVAA